MFETLGLPCCHLGHIVVLSGDGGEGGEPMSVGTDALAVAAAALVLTILGPAAQVHGSRPLPCMA